MNIEEFLQGAGTVGITGHVRPDGDCVGSCMGLYNYIKKNFPDIEVTVFLEEPGEEFSYIANISEIRTEVEGTPKFDLFVVLDSSSRDRIQPFDVCFANAARTLCIDHHISNDKFAMVNVVENVSSACEVLYGLLDESKIDKAVAECIYTGIIHDTGVLKYSSTTSTTMTIAGKMMDKGVDFTDIIDNSFYKKSYAQNRIMARALLDSKLLHNGQFIYSVVNGDVMQEFGLEGRQLGGIIEQLRLTDGVEVAVFMYETDEDEYKVSMRSKRYVDVSRIATGFGGGGHVRAAGFTMKGSPDSIIKVVDQALKTQLDEAGIDCYEWNNQRI